MCMDDLKRHKHETNSCQGIFQCEECEKSCRLKHELEGMQKPIRTIPVMSVKRFLTMRLHWKVILKLHMKELNYFAITITTKKTALIMMINVCFNKVSEEVSMERCVIEKCVCTGMRKVKIVRMKTVMKMKKMQMKAMSRKGSTSN